MKISNGAPVLAHRVRDAVRISGIGRSTLYGHIRTGRLKTVKHGYMRLVPDTSLREFLQLEERQASGEDQVMAAKAEFPPPQDEGVAPSPGAAMSEFAAIIGDVARRLLGDCNPDLSTKTQLRFGTHGSLSVEIAGPKAGQWYDFEEGEGGGVLDFVMRKKECDKGRALDWLKTEGFTNAAAKCNLGPIVAVYDYVDEAGTLLFQVCRYEPRLSVRAGPMARAAGPGI